MGSEGNGANYLLVTFIFPIILLKIMALNYFIPCPGDSFLPPCKPLLDEKTALSEWVNESSGRETTGM